MTNPIDRLLSRLDLDEAGTDEFVGGAGPGGVGHPGRLFGGLVAAQAFIAAARTVDVGPIHSLHLYFLRPGRASRPIRYRVERIKQGRRFQARQIRGTQDGDLIFQMMASFSADRAGVEHQDPMPEVPDPETLPNTDRARGRPDWDKQPIDVRTCAVEPGRTTAEHLIWFRPVASLPEEPLLHTAVLVFASDRRLSRTAALPHADAGEFAGASLDHSLWFHDSIDLRDWHLHATHSPVARHQRGLALGGLYRRDGRRVASSAQEAALLFNDASGDPAERSEPGRR
jgi:acyl-CoA thioesterase-2